MNEFEKALESLSDENLDAFIAYLENLLETQDTELRCWGFLRWAGLTAARFFEFAPCVYLAGRNFFYYQKVRPATRSRHLQVLISAFACTRAFRFQYSLSFSGLYIQPFLQVRLATALLLPAIASHYPQRYSSNVTSFSYIIYHCYLKVNICWLYTINKNWFQNLLIIFYQNMLTNCKHCARI